MRAVGLLRPPSWRSSKGQWGPRATSLDLPLPCSAARIPDALPSEPASVTSRAPEPPGAIVLPRTDSEVWHEDNSVLKTSVQRRNPCTRDGQLIKLVNIVQTTS